MDQSIVLRKQLDLKDIVATAMNVLIGSGIFVSPVGILKHMGSLGMSLILWLFCGLIQLAYATCYAELGTRIPQSGGEYIYLYHIYGGLVSCFKLWSLFPQAIIIFGILTKLTVVYILEPLYPHCAIPFLTKVAVYLVLIGLVSFMNCYSVKAVANLQILTNTCKIVSLVAISTMAIYNSFYGQVTTQIHSPFEDSNFNPLSFVMAFYSGMWALDGWEAICNITGELKNPKKDLMLGLTISLVISIILYLSVNVSYSSVLTKVEMLSSPAVAVSFALKLYGSGYAWIMCLCIAVSTFGSLNSGMFSLSRNFYMGSKTGNIPECLGFISVSRRTPIVAVLLMSVFCVISLCVTDVFYIMEITGFVNTIMTALCIIGLMLLRRRSVEQNDIIKAPPLIPEISVIILFILIVFTIIKRPISSILILLTIPIGYSIPYVLLVGTTKPKMYYTILKKVNSFIQKLFVCLPEES